jgi:hypothetical protein
MSRIALAAALCLLVSAASAQSNERKATLEEDARFCPSWAEAHERTMASLNNNGRRPPGARWKGCMILKKGTEVDVVDSDAMQTEIVYKKKHWFSDQGL